MGPLGDDDLATAVRSLVDGEVDPALVERVVALAGGSPLTAHEMFVGAIEAGAVGPVDGRWMALDSLERTPRVTDLVTQRMGRLAEATRRGLGMVALAEPLPLTWVPLAAVAELATLEDAGLIRVEAGSGRGGPSPVRRGAAGWTQRAPAPGAARGRGHHGVGPFPARGR